MVILNTINPEPVSSITLKVRVFSMRQNEAVKSEFIGRMSELVAMVEETLISPTVAEVYIGIEIWDLDGSVFFDSVSTKESGGQP